MRVCGIRLRKAAWHGRLRVSRAQDRNSPTESHEGLDPGRVISVGKSPIPYEHRGCTVGPFVDTARGRCYGVTPSGGCREEDLSAAPQEPQTHARISQANADARGT